jgi:deazaflavin-dependent oxidoreductase (nitroreductase family)
MPGKLSDNTPPRGLMRALLRTPIWLYRFGLGGLLGDRFLLLTHIGRKSGQPRQSVLEVVGYDEQIGSFVVASGWGEKADWLRNVQNNPHVLVQSGARRFEATAERLLPEQAAGVVRNYAKRYPAAFRALAGRMTGQPLTGGDADYHALAQAIPFVILRPSAPNTP